VAAGEAIEGSGGDVAGRREAVHPGEGGKSVVEPDAAEASAVEQEAACGGLPLAGQSQQG
jgi:hypothetical protein